MVIAHFLNEVRKFEAIENTELAFKKCWKLENLIYDQYMISNDKMLLALAMKVHKKDLQIFATLHGDSKIC